MEEGEEGKESGNSEKKYEKESKETAEGSKKAENRHVKIAELSGIRDRIGSQGTISDYIKKRRREQERELTEKAEKEILERFNKEKRVSRSPPNKIKKEERRKESIEAEKMLKEILEKLEEQERERKKDKEEIMKEMQDLREEYRKSEAVWEKQKVGIENRMKRLEKKMEEAERGRGGEGENEHQHSELMERMREIERRNELEERRRRRNNIIIKGVKVEDERERKEKIENLLGGIAERKVEVEEVQVVGNRENKMILVRLRRWEDKKEVMVRRKEMRKERKIFIDDDMTVIERKIQKQLWNIVKEQREKGKRATLGYQKIWIDGCERRWNEREGKLEDGGGFGEGEEERKRGNVRESVWGARRRRRRGIEEGKERIGERETGMTVGFWNIAGLKGKNEKFWKEMEEWDIITLLETWVKKKD